MESTLSSETSAFILQTPGKFPKEHRLHSKHGESLKTTNIFCCYRHEDESFKLKLAINLSGLQPLWFVSEDPQQQEFIFDTPNLKLFYIKQKKTTLKFAYIPMEYYHTKFRVRK